MNGIPGTHRCIRLELSRRFLKDSYRNGGVVYTFIRITDGQGDIVQSPDGIKV